MSCSWGPGAAGGGLPWAPTAGAMLRRLLVSLAVTRCLGEVADFPKAGSVSPRFPLKGFFKGDIDMDIDVDVDMDIESDVAKLRAQKTT